MNSTQIEEKTMMIVNRMYKINPVIGKKLLFAFLHNITNIQIMVKFWNKSPKLKILSIIRYLFVKFGSFHGDYDCDGYTESSSMLCFYYRYTNFDYNPHVHFSISLGKVYKSIDLNPMYL